MFISPGIFTWAFDGKGKISPQSPRRTLEVLCFKEDAEINGQYAKRLAAFLKF
jgi:hypothetical protein